MSKINRNQIFLPPSKKDKPSISWFCTCIGLTGQKVCYKGSLLALKQTAMHAFHKGTHSKYAE